jgi:hypothetical protein
LVTTMVRPCRKYFRSNRAENGYVLWIALIG